MSELLVHAEEIKMVPGFGDLAVGDTCHTDAVE